MTQRKNPFINRELSWLEFNQRVLDEALNEQVPLLERVKFLAITSSNLDEFFMVRVGGLQLMLAAKDRRRDVAGMTPNQQLDSIAVRTHRMVEDQYRCYNEEIGPALTEAGISRILPEDLTDEQVAYLDGYFSAEIFPVVSPLPIEPEADFPLLTGTAFAMLVRIRDEEAEGSVRHSVIPVAQSMMRFVSLPSEGGYCCILTEDLLRMYIDRMYIGQQVLECIPFRITRNADMSVREDQAGDLLVEMEEVLKARTVSNCVRLEVDNTISVTALRYLRKTLNLKERDIYRISGPLQLSAFMRMGFMDGYEDYQYRSWPPQRLPDLNPQGSIFDELQQRNLLLNHPYEKFDPVLRLVEEAADDPDVIAIKQILYRTSRNSPIIAALARAAENGKYVTALVELKARFDEARNITWARELEQSGVQVIYGVKGLKTHAKILMVVRREPQGVMRYMHFGTGNYNESTARLYSDISYMTCDENLATDASAFFNAISGYSEPPKYLKLEAAPLGLRDRLIELIESEIERARHGQKAVIMAKFNSLVCPIIIDALYRASKAGVKIMLNIRGICCLRPGVPGVSENIEVISIVDRFLEHSRIMYFRHGGEDRVYISSADWMNRNLDRRVELLVPIDDKACRRKLIKILKVYFSDTVKASRLLPTGQYERVSRARGKKRVRSQEKLYQQACRAVKEAESSRRTVFEPHLPPEES